MRSLPRAALAALLALTLSGCAQLQSIAASAFAPPKLHFESWAPQDLDLEGVTVLLKYRVENPNRHGFRLSKVAWALDLEGKPAAKGDMPAGLSVPASGTAPLEVPIRLRWRDLPEVAKLLGRDEVGFRISGNAALASPFGEVDVPFSREGRVPVPRPPGFALEGVRVRELSLTNLSLELKLRLTNTNRFPLPVGALAWGLRLGESDVAKGNGLPLASVPPGGSATVTVPIRLSLASAGDAIQRLLRGGEVPLELKGEAEIGGMDFPFDADGAVRRPTPSAPARPAG